MNIATDPVEGEYPFVLTLLTRRALAASAKNDLPGVKFVWICDVGFDSLEHATLAFGSGTERSVIP